MSDSTDSLSQPVSEAMPSGENLEYDPLYLEMETLVRPKSESIFDKDDATDIDTDWRSLEKCTTELLQNTRDLRVQVYATIASLRTRGIPSFRNNLKVLNSYLEDFWDTVHPQLDPDDNNDPTLRMSSLQVLNDHRLVVMPLDRVKLVELKGVGKFSVRDVDLALGKETAAEGEEVSDINLVRQAFLTSDLEYLDKLNSAVAESRDLLNRLNNTWKEKANDKAGLEIDDILKGLRRVSSVLNEFSPVSSNESSETEESGAEPQMTAANSASAAVNNRADVIRLLDKICDYYQVNEPSSPIPLLLRRAQRLVEKSFMEILEDMVPDGVNQAKIVGGQQDGD